MKTLRLVNEEYGFFSECAVNTPVSGPMLQTKAKAIAEELHIENLYASNGFLEVFREKPNLFALSGESVGVDLQAVEVGKINCLM